jgi:hypothetical protein
MVFVDLVQKCKNGSILDIARGRRELILFLVSRGLEDWGFYSISRTRAVRGKKTMDQAIRGYFLLDYASTQSTVTRKLDTVTDSGFFHDPIRRQPG